MAAERVQLAEFRFGVCGFEEVFEAVRAVVAHAAFEVPACLHSLGWAALVGFIQLADLDARRHTFDLPESDTGAPAGGGFDEYRQFGSGPVEDRHGMQRAVEEEEPLVPADIDADMAAVGRETWSA